MELIGKIFSIRTTGVYWVIRIFGIKIKILSVKKQLKENTRLINNLRKDNALAHWKINYLTEFVNCEELKDIILNQRFISIFNNNYYLNIENPKTFNEKIHWLRKYYLLDNKLTDLITDKLSFKTYISEKVGSKYVTPLLGKWQNSDDINYDLLPDKFVFKSTWGGDGDQVLIIKNKSEMNVDEVRKKLLEWIVPWGNPYYYAFTPVFKNLEPCIIAEEYIDNVYDYKFFCFNGEPKLFAAANSFIGERINRRLSYFDMDKKRVSLFYSGFLDASLDELYHFEEMKNIATTLSKDFPFVRVDFLNTKDKLYVGELTFTPDGGFRKHTPIDWDHKFGEMLDIEDLMRSKNA